MNKEQFEKAAINGSMIAGLFTLLVAVIMLFNYVQIQRTDPLETETMELLVEQMRDDPRNEALKNEIRSLDLMARKAFFNNQWQVKTGRYLLLFGAILFLAGLRYYAGARSRIEEPGSGTLNENLQRLLSQRWIIVFGGLIFILAFMASFAVVNHLKVYQFNIPPESGLAEEVPASQIEIVPVREQAEEESGAESQVTEASSDDGSSDKPGTEDKPTNEVTPGVIAEPVFDFPSLDVIRANYNSFRGALGQGVDYHKNIPVDWDGATEKNIIWKIQLSKPGYNSPVIWNDKLFIAGGDKTARMVYCLNRETGKMIWEHEVTNVPGSSGSMPKVSEDTGLSAPSLTTDGRYVYAIFATGDIVALTIEGKRVWARNLGLPNNHYGHSSSLLVWGNQVFLQYDTNSGGRVLSLNSRTGETVWDVSRNSGISWASPILAQLNGNLQLILTADPIVAGYDIKTGQELWSVACMMGEVGPSPAFSDGLVFAGNEYARLVAIRPGPQAEIIWEDDYYLPEVASPVASNGLLFVATTYGVLVCYDAMTGEKYWEQEYNQGFYSSPVIAEGKLYAMDLDGIMHILKVSKTFEVLGEPELGESATTTPAFADGRIFIRGDVFLYCIGQK